MRLQGKIIRLINEHSGGRIKLDKPLRIGFSKFKSILFNSKDISNSSSVMVRVGQIAAFDVQETPDGLRAINVFIVPDDASVQFDPDRIDRLDSSYESTASDNRNKQDVGLNKNSSVKEQEFIAFALIDKKIKLVSLTKDGAYKFLDEEQNLHSILYTTISETILLQTAIEEFESLINNPSGREADFQDFFERNPDFILNDEYRQAHPHVVLSRDDGEKLIPDFILEPVEQSSLCDLLELKLPSTGIFVLKKNRARYSAAVFEAAAQLREYSRFFDEEENRKRFQQTYQGLRAFRPRMFVIIGRQGNEDPIIKRSIQTEFPGLVLRTYDEVLERMKWKAEKMKRGKLRI